MHTLMSIWFILLILSLVFVVTDVLTRAPVSWVQKLAWILVTFYSGLVVLFCIGSLVANLGIKIMYYLLKQHGNKV